MIQYITVEELISKYLRDMQHVSQDKFDESDIIEWIGEAEEYIGSFNWFKRNEVILPIENFQARLPCDFFEIIGIWYNSNLVICPDDIKNKVRCVGEVVNQYDLTASERMRQENEIRINNSYQLNKLNGNQYYVDFGTGNYQFNSNQYMISGWTRVHYNGSNFRDFRKEPSNAQLDPTRHVYYIQNDAININIREGCLAVVYDAIPVDSRNYPLIKNTIYHREACVAYIVMKMNYPRLLRGEINENTFAFIKREWISSMMKARSDDKMMTQDQREHFRKMWHRMVQMGNDWRNGYGDTTSNDTWTRF